MIVPSSRLLVWFGIVVLPFAGLSTALPRATLLSFIIMGVFFAIVVADAVLSWRRLHGVTVEFPDTVRLTKDREGNIAFRVTPAGRNSLQLRLGLAFPPEFAADKDDILVSVPAKVTSQFHWSVRPLRRGRYAFSACYTEIPSRMGLWDVRRAFPVRFEIRVYPNLLKERKDLAALFLNRGTFGLHTRRQVGQGREFEKLREYIPGDSYDLIHWKAMARRGRPITKVFQVERTQEVYVVIDASRLSARPTPDRVEAVPAEGPGPQETVVERFITAALVLGVAAERQGDLFGVITFSDKVDGFIRAKSGKTHYNTCRDALYGLRSRLVTPDFNELCSFLGLRLRRRALLIMLTNLDDPVLMESFEQNVDLLRRKHLLLVAMLQPRGVQPLFTGAPVRSIDDLYQGLGGHFFWHNLRELNSALQRKGILFSLLTNEKASAQLVSQYLDIKQRQLL